MKVCSKCKETKDESEFNKRENGKLRGQCKKCRRKYYIEYCEENKNKINERSKKYYEENKDKAKKKHKKYYEENKEKISERDKKYYEENKEKISERERKYRKENNDKIIKRQRKYRKENNDRFKEKNKQHNKEYHKENKDKINERKKEYYEKNKNRINENNRKYHKENKDKINERKREYSKIRRKIDKNFDIKSRLRSRVRKAFKLYSIFGKMRKSDEYGINYEAIIKHLGDCPGDLKDYHIDHIKPISLFDFNDLEQIKEAFAPENHQWLTKEENLKKSSTYEEK